jgi:uncharacterized membrane protein (DUF441 family)
MAAEQRVTALLACVAASLTIFLACVAASLTIFLASSAASLAIFLASSAASLTITLLAGAVFAAALLRGVTTTLATLLGSAYPEHTVEQLEPETLLGTQGDPQDHRP